MPRAPLPLARVAPVVGRIEHERERDLEDLVDLGRIGPERDRRRDDADHRRDAVAGAGAVFRQAAEQLDAEQLAAPGVEIFAEMVIEVLRARRRIIEIPINYYNRDPKAVDTTKLMMELQDKYSPFDYEADTHFQCSFGHLDGYSAIYYTYMWSLVLAKDLFSAFGGDLFDAEVAGRYRRAVLEPGGSKDAELLVQDFLGRPFAFAAFEKWLAA